jgi:cyclomaltodextrinase
VSQHTRLTTLRSRSGISALVALAAIGHAAAAGLFLGPIPVQFVGAGTELVLDLHRFCDAPADARFEIKSSDAAQVTFDADRFQLRISTPDSFRGLVDLPFVVSAGKQRKAGILTLAVRAPSKHEFVYRPEGDVSTVAVAGVFNNWSKDKDLLSRSPDGVFRAVLPFEPGTYTYKLVVDGKWLPDPANALSSPDGMGGTSSPLQVGNPPGPPPIAIFADQLSNNSFSVQVAVGAAEKVSAVVELPDGSSAQIAPHGSAKSISIPASKVPAGAYLRVVAADREGNISNVVRCALGRQSHAWADAVMYYALTDRFCDGDKSNDKPVDDPSVLPPANFHGGDWRGIEQKMAEGYFEKLGVNTVWLAPLNRNPAAAYREYPEPHRWYTGYHGYWPVSPTEVEPHFGDRAALKSLVRTAHNRGLRVIADLVLHHVHEDHPWWKQHRDWFGALELPDGTKNLRKWDDYAFTTWFEPFLPTFNWDRADAIATLIDNSAWWANEFDLDGFRLDAVKHIPQHFWPKFRAALRDKVEAKHHRTLYFVGETFKDRAGIASFVGPNMLDGQFDFPLYDSIKDAFGTRKIGLDVLESSLAASEATFGKEALMSPLIGNHDKGRFMAYADGQLPDRQIEKEEEVGWQHPPQVRDATSYAKIELAQAFLMSIDGVPMVYYGDEIGMTGAGDPDNRRDMRFGDQVSQPEHGVLTNFELLGKLRREHAALHSGSRRPVIVEPDLLAFIRAQLADRVLCVFNRAGNEITREIVVGPELQDGDYLEALSGTPATVRDGKMIVHLPAERAAFFVASKR